MRSDDEQRAHPPSPRPLVVVALGGNALLPMHSAGALEDQWRAVRVAAEGIASLASENIRLLISHGNGPQVGNQMKRAAAAEPDLPPLSLDYAVAQTQGGIGFSLVRALSDALGAKGTPLPVASLITQVEVDAEDPAFESPSKPIGPFLDRIEVERGRQEFNWHFKKVAPGPRGWRRVVASPRPRNVTEINSIRALLEAGTLLIAGGGGGVPIVQEAALWHGVPAVIDKDHVASLLARELDASTLIIATAVPKVEINFGQSNARTIDRMSASEASEYLAQGHFPAGSMGPKIEAAIEFASFSDRLDKSGDRKQLRFRAMTPTEAPDLEHQAQFRLEGLDRIRARPSRRAVICDLENLQHAWQGGVGTEIYAAEDVRPDDRH